MRHMAAYRGSQAMRRKAATWARGHTTGKIGRAASKSITDHKSKASALSKPSEKTKLRKPGRPPSAPNRAASAPRRTANRDAAVAAQLKTISDDLQAIVSLRNEVHELRLSIKTLTERVDTLLKATKDDIDHRSEPSEPKIVAKDRPDSEV